MKRSIEFWVNVMKLGEGRLLKEVVREAMKFGGRVQWVKHLKMGLEALSGLSLSKVKPSHIEVYGMEES